MPVGVVCKKGLSYYDISWDTDSDRMVTMQIASNDSTFTISPDRLQSISVVLILLMSSLIQTVITDVILAKVLTAALGLKGYWRDSQIARGF